MSNPLDLKQFRHFLNFNNDDTGIIEISEPVKFDAAEFKIEQDDKGYARDITYMSDEVSLEFYKGYYELSETQTQTESGVVVNNLSHAFEKLIRYDKDYGYQSEIQYILRRNGVDFILGELNFEGRETDHTTYFNCKVIQQTKRALAKRREDVKINGFSNEDLDGNEITPISPENILIKAKPVTAFSEWDIFEPINNINLESEANTGDQSRTYILNYCNNVISYGLENTLSFIRPIDYNFPTIIPETSGIDDLRYIRALDDISNISFDLSFDFSGIFQTDNTNINIKHYYYIGESFNYSDKILIDEFTQERLSPLSISNDFTYSENILLSDISISRENIFWYWTEVIIKKVNGSFGPSRVSCDLSVNSQNIKIKGSSTAISTVVKAVKYIDLAKQSLKAINGMELTALDHESGGKFDNLFAFSGNLIRQRDDVPFYFTFKDRRKNLMLMNSDIQINSENAFCLTYDNFYSDIDNGGFEIIPSSESNTTYNQRYAINLLEWQFKDYEKDRDEENTLDSVHTQAQFSINNTKVKNTKKIDISDIYDPFKIESVRRQQFKETTALDGDDKIHCLDCVLLAPNSKSGFTASMQHQIDSTTGYVKLLKDANLPSWSLLGFNVGDDGFEIKTSENQGTYEVIEIENSVITLRPIFPLIQNENGNFLTEVEYFLSNVGYTNRTNEGFDIIDNLIEPNNYSNLRYTIRRNLINWESYINTCATYINENPKNTEFKNNGLLVTQFNGGETYTENGDIDLQTIKSPILTPRIYDITIKLDYDSVLQLIRKYEEIETAGGFIRVQFVDGSVKRIYPKTLGYTWATSELNIIGEEKVFNTDIKISNLNGNIEVNGVEYEYLGYEANGNLLSLLDENSIKIINFTEFSKYNVNNNTFETIEDLIQSIIDL